MRSIPKVMVGLLVGLLIAVIVAMSDQSDDHVHPAADSYGPSGLRAFYELLVQNGYHPVIDRRKRADIRPGDVVVTGDIVREAGETPSANQRANEWVDERVEEGAVRINLRLADDFDRTSRSVLAANPRTVTLNATTTTAVVRAPLTLEEDPLAESFWKDETGDLVNWSVMGDGRVYEVGDGLPFTNRFIDRDDDARFAMSIVRAAAPSGARVVFAEATWSGAEDAGFFATIGRWALAGYHQALFWFFACILAAGVRFGLPDVLPKRERGQRELLDAIAFTSRRAGMASEALTAASQKFDREIRATLRIRLDAPIEERDRALTTDVIVALRQLDVAIHEPKLNSDRALELVDKAQGAVDAWRSRRA